jgi:hypothetical protein
MEIYTWNIIKFTDIILYVYLMSNLIFLISNLTLKISIRIYGYFGQENHFLNGILFKNYQILSYIFWYILFMSKIGLKTKFWHG